MGQLGGTLPGPAGGVPWWGYPGRGDTLVGGTLPGPAGGYPGGGYPAGGLPWPGGYPGGGGVPYQVQQGGTLGGTLPGPARGVPCQGGVPWLGGYPGLCTLAGGVPCLGGTQLGQHREYLLHGRRYASCDSRSVGFYSCRTS